jgi:hypothetical protein
MYFHQGFKACAYLHPYKEKCHALVFAYNLENLSLGLCVCTLIPFSYQERNLNHRIISFHVGALPHDN